MESHPLYGKRKKEASHCPNPLFIQWLVEWKDDAGAKGLKTQYTYAKEVEKEGGLYQLYFTAEEHVTEKKLQDMVLGIMKIHALRSLMKYPLPLQSGKECKMLEYFGDKLCGMLDDKLQEYVEEYGTTSPVPGYITVAAAKLKGKRVRKTAVKPAGGSSSCREPFRSSASACISLDSGSSDDEGQVPAPAPQPECRSSGGGGQKRGGYMPAYRSGPYALILTLHNDLQNAGSRGFMTKTELMKEAQPMAEKSFRIPDPGSRYTAWSSMGSLITKGFIIKESSPAKYRLTDQGKELALKILDHYQDNIGGIGLSSDDMDYGFVIGRHVLAVSDNQANPHLPSLHQHPVSMYSGEDQKEYPAQYLRQGLPQSYANTGMNSNNNQKYTPDTLDARNRETIDLSMDDDTDADIDVDPHGVGGFEENVGVSPDTSNGPLLTKTSGCPSSQDVLPSLRDRILNQSSKSAVTQAPHSMPAPLPSCVSPPQECSSQFKFSYVGEDGANVASKDTAVVTVDEEISVGFLIRCEHIDLIMSGKKYKLDNTRSRIGKDVFAFLADDDAPDYCSLKSSQTTQPSCQATNPCDKVKHSAVNGLKNSTGGPASDPISKRHVSRSIPPPTHQKAASAGNPLLQQTVRDKPVLSHLSSTSGSSSSQDSQKSTTSATSTLPEPDFILEPGTFDIVLIVDKCEHFGGSEKSSKAILIPELQKNALQFEVRSLSIADFIWIAKPKSSSSGAGIKNENCELVLDHVVERKRMDDLAGSIVDGRFKEQKFRLRNCGARQPIYLVEDYGSCQHFSITEDALKQAIVNTQVVDGFYVKRTKDMRESISYLTMMTRYMQSAYSSKRLIACSKAVLQDAEFKNDMKLPEQRLITYREFNQASVKTKALTVREMLGKQLVQLHGITVEKVLAVLCEYPTPNSLFEAYSDCQSEKEREAVLSELRFGPMKRKLGPVVSKQVSVVYCSTTVAT